MVLVLTSISKDFLIPWLPMPLSRKPWKGKWSGPRAGALFTYPNAQVFLNMKCTGGKMVMPQVSTGIHVGMQLTHELHREQDITTSGVSMELPVEAHRE